MHPILPQHLHPQSRVWIYQSDRIFNDVETQEIRKHVQEFVQSWKSHGADVKGFADIYYHMFIVFIADESTVQVGGCSTDSSVRIVKSIEQQFAVQMFDRTRLTFNIDEQLKQISIDNLETEISKNTISGETLYFNNIISTKQELENNWIIPLKISWLNKFLITEKL